jgi:hypothetical protein
VLQLAPPASRRLSPRVFYAFLVMLLVSGFESESFLQGASLYAAAVPLLLLLASVEGATFRSLLPSLVVAIIALFLCGAGKISAGFFVGVALLAVLWNLRQTRGAVATLLIGMAVMAVPLYVLALPKDLSLSGLPLAWRVMDYYGNYFNLTTVLSYCVPLIVAWSLEARLRAAPGPGRQWVLSWSAAGTASGSFLERARVRLEQSDPAALIAGLSVVACILVLVTQYIGSNVAYFSLYIYLLGLLLLPLAVRRGGMVLPSLSGAVLPGALLAIITGLGIFPLFDKMPVLLGALYREASGEGAHYTARVRAEIAQSLRQTHRPFATLESHISQLPWPRFVAEVERLDAVQSGKLAVQLAPGAEDVWRRLSTGSAYWCMVAPSMIPAEAGVVELRSMAPRAIEAECAPPGTVWYGFGALQDRHRTAEFSDTELCALAAPVRADAIYRVLSYQDISRNRLVMCGKD